ncbi:MAG: hypothetical protein LBL75_01930 [Rickettsiales bacterium]|jgi:hypothetical protein|nr:hypothetical protein [Rickettsiales bacterium]
MQHTQTTAIRRLSEMFMDDIPVTEVAVKSNITIPNDWFQTYIRVRRDFMSSLSDSIPELAFMNLPQDIFMDLLMGRKLPPDTSLRFRIPLWLGGEISVDNMFMTRTFPNSHNLDRFIIEQSGAATMWLPNPVKKIYISAHTAGGGDGGNATSDRLSQLAAGIVASNRGME